MNRFLRGVLTGGALGLLAASALWWERAGKEADWPDRLAGLVRVAGRTGRLFRDRI